MFTGIIEEVGKVQQILPIEGGIRFHISANLITNDLKIGDSISINGTCLTTIAFSENQFIVEAVGETLEKTTIGQLIENESINMERAMRGDGRFGGHFVQGHVNATAQILDLHARGENWYLEVEIPESLQPCIILEGSICIDGISLTVAQLDDRRMGINIIPHTYQSTHLHHKKLGDWVNLEVDVIAKYVENLLKYKGLDKN